MNNKENAERILGLLIDSKKFISGEHIELGNGCGFYINKGDESDIKSAYFVLKVQGIEFTHTDSSDSDIHFLSDEYFKKLENAIKEEIIELNGKKYKLMEE